MSMIFKKLMIFMKISNAINILIIIINSMALNTFNKIEIVINMQYDV